MALTVVTVLQYFSKDDLKEALYEINEPLSGKRVELARRLYKEWPEHNRTVFDLLDILDKPTLSTICYNFNLDHKGNKDTLKKRIVKEIEKNSAVKNEIESKDFSENTTGVIQHIGFSNKKKMIIGSSIFAAILLFSTIGSNFVTISDYLEKRMIPKDEYAIQNSENQPTPYEMASLAKQFSDFELNLEYQINSPNIYDGPGGVLYDAFIANRGNDATQAKTFWIVRQECENGHMIEVNDGIEKSDERLLRKADGKQGLQLEIPKIYPGLDKKRTFFLEIRSGGYPHETVPLETKFEFMRTYIQFDYNNDTGSWNPHVNEDFILDCTSEPTKQSRVTLSTMDDKMWIKHD